MMSCLATIIEWQGFTTFVADVVRISFSHIPSDDENIKIYINYLMANMIISFFMLKVSLIT